VRCGSRSAPPSPWAPRSYSLVGPLSCLSVRPSTSAWHLACRQQYPDCSVARQGYFWWCSRWWATTAASGPTSSRPSTDSSASRSRPLVVVVGPALSNRPQIGQPRLPPPVNTTERHYRFPSHVVFFAFYLHVFGPLVSYSRPLEGASAVDGLDGLIGRLGRGRPARCASRVATLQSQPSCAVSLGGYRHIRDQLPLQPLQQLKPCFASPTGIGSVQLWGEERRLVLSW
jgi:hypothetical protein